MYTFPAALIFRGTGYNVLYLLQPSAIGFYFMKRGFDARATNKCLLPLPPSAAIKASTGTTINILFTVCTWCLLDDLDEEVFLRFVSFMSSLQI